MIRIIKRCLPVLLVAGAGLTLTLTGCKSDGDAGATTQASVNMGAINDTCPIMTDNKVDSGAETVSYDGVTIGFCCGGCVNKWNALSDTKKRQ
ncbi:MAG: hypothetical protein O7G85_01935, partial [Planctomycetota bacterium]|nr:hypothetical protein [Planctomycetota bacterium]